MFTSKRTLSFQVSFPAFHLARNPCKSVPGVFPRLPPGTESLRKCSRCLFPPSTWHGIPAKAFQVPFPCRPPATVFPQKRVRCLFSAFHLARNSCESVPGSFSYRPPGTEFLQKCSRCLFPLSTWHGIPAKAFQVAFPAVHLPRFSCKSVPGGRLLLEGV